MSDLIREMCVEYENGAHRSNEEAMRAALLWLADNVDTEVMKASFAAQSRVLKEGTQSSAVIHLECIKAAIRSAAGESK